MTFHHQMDVTIYYYSSYQPLNEYLETFDLKRFLREEQAILRREQAKKRKDFLEELNFDLQQLRRPDQWG